VPGDRPSPPRILIIDDEEPIRFAVREYFQHSGYAVDCAQEAEEAEALLAHVRYDAVIADLRLTGIYRTEGLGIISSVRERCPWTRTVLLTAFGSPEVEREARRLGVDAFLHKPRPLAELAGVVAELLGHPAEAG
jgi:two-component system nitrogen regulation response regulator NtrX